jgi:hypothetical protein
MRRLLTIATAVCGERAAGAVIEPLLADWQKELALARSQGFISYATAATAGALALVRSLIVCAIAEGVWLPPARGTMLSILAIAFSVAVSIAILLIPPLPRASRSLADPMTQGWLLVMSSTVLPPAFLLAMFMHRRDRRATVRHAIVGITFAAAATIVVVFTTNPETLNRRYNTFEMQERIRARTLAAAKSDPSIYKGNGYQRALATTVEQRRASYQRLQSKLAEWQRNDPPPTWGERFAQLQPIPLSIVFAIMGWTLGGIGPVTVSRGLIWWALVLMATIAMSTLLSLLVGVPMPRPAQWWMLPMFTSMALVLVTAGQETWWSKTRGES